MSRKTTFLNSGNPHGNKVLNIGECTNNKCNEEVYPDEGIEFGGQFFCNPHCLGTHLVNEGQAVDMGKGY